MGTVRPYLDASVFSPHPSAAVRFVLTCLPAALLVLPLAACGGAQSGGDSDTLNVAGRAPDTAAIYEVALTPSTLKDPRIEELSNAERRVLQDYVNRGIRRDSLEDPASQNSLGGWLDSNLTVGEVIALYRGTQKIEPLPPDYPTPQSPTQVPPQRE